MSVKVLFDIIKGTHFKTRNIPHNMFFISQETFLSCLFFFYFETNSNWDLNKVYDIIQFLHALLNIKYQKQI